MRRLVAIPCGLLVALLLASTSSAGKPVREFLPAGDFTLTGVCPFPVGIEVTRNKEFGTTFSDGRFLITGSLKVRVTNLNSEESVDLNISGPGVITANPDGSLTFDSHGPWLFWFFPGDLGPGSQGQLFVNRGNLVLTAGPAGTTIHKQTGSQQDICAALA